MARYATSVPIRSRNSRSPTPIRSMACCIGSAMNASISSSAFPWARSFASCRTMHARPRRSSIATWSCRRKERRRGAGSAGGSAFHATSRTRPGELHITRPGWALFRGDRRRWIDGDRGHAVLGRAFDQAIRVGQVHERISLPVDHPDNADLLEHQGDAFREYLLLQCQRLRECDRTHALAIDRRLRLILGNAEGALDAAGFCARDVARDAAHAGVVMRVDDDLVVGPDQLEDGVDFADGFGRREWSERQQQQGNTSVHDALPESPKSALPAAVAVTDVSPTRSGADNDTGVCLRTSARSAAGRRRWLSTNHDPHGKRMRRFRGESLVVE